VQYPFRLHSLIILILSTITVSSCALLDQTCEVEGGSWIIRGTGSSDILRGLPIYLCNGKVATALEPVSEPKTADYFGLSESLTSMEPIVSKSAIQTTSTDIDGKYKFTKVEPGSYFVYAPLQTSFSVGYWLIPVQIEKGTHQKIDLYNTSMKSMYNK
jgi:hypothetical protein